MRSNFQSWSSRIEIFSKFPDSIPRVIMTQTMAALKKAQPRAVRVISSINCFQYHVRRTALSMLHRANNHQRQHQVESVSSRSQWRPIAPPRGSWGAREGRGRKERGSHHLNGWERSNRRTITRMNSRLLPLFNIEIELMAEI